MVDLPDGVHVLELGVDGRSFHAAAVETAAGLLLVDAGLPGTADVLATALGDAGFDIDDLAMLVFTHQDGDHAGGGAAVRERSGAVTLAHERAAPYIDGREAPVKSGGERYPPVAVDVELGGGSGFNTAVGPLEVIETPGHAPGHVSLYAPAAKLLFAGDALTAADGEVRPPKPQFTPRPGVAARSVGRLARRDVERVVCYHGGTVEVEPGDIAAVRESMTAETE